MLYINQLYANVQKMLYSIDSLIILTIINQPTSRYHKVKGNIHNKYIGTHTDIRKLIAIYIGKYISEQINTN